MAWMSSIGAVNDEQADYIVTVRATFFSSLVGYCFQNRFHPTQHLCIHAINVHRGTSEQDRSMTWKKFHFILSSKADFQYLDMALVLCQWKCSHNLVEEMLLPR